MTTHNKVAVVISAGTGIGKAVTLALLHDGDRVALAGRRREPLEQTVGQSGEAARALVVPADVSDAGSVQALFARVKERFGRMGISYSTTPAFSFPVWRSMNSASSSGKRWWTSTAMKPYVAEVRGNKFPEDEHCYHMLPGELEKFQDELK